MGHQNTSTNYICTLITILVIISLATLTSTSAATVSSPAYPPTAASPLGSPVCDGEGIPASVLFQDEAVLSTLLLFVASNEANFIDKTYNPVLHAALIDCGCAKIEDTRSAEQMMDVYVTFCQSVQFDHVFEPFMVATLEAAATSTVPDTSTTPFPYTPSTDPYTDAEESMDLMNSLV